MLPLEKERIMPNHPETLSRRDCLKRGLSSLVVIPLGLATNVILGPN